MKVAPKMRIASTSSAKFWSKVLTTVVVVTPMIAVSGAFSPVKAVSNAPTFSWIAGGDGTGSSNAPVNAVAVDSNGNSYITGWISGTLDFAGNGIGGANSFGDVVSTTQDAYLAQYNSSGVLQWVKHITSAGTDFTTGVTVDGNDNVIVVGSFSGTIDLAGDGVGGAGDLTSLGSNDLFMAKYSAAGNFVWAKRAGGTGNDSGWQGAVFADSSGNVYLNVPFVGTADFGGDGIGGTGDLVSLGGTADNAVVKYNSSGVYQWSNRIGSASTEWPQEITTDSSNNVLVIGNSAAAVTDFGGDGIGGTGDVTNRGSYDAYLAKYSPSGALTWAKSIGSTGSDWGADISTGTSDTIMVSAYFKLTMDSAGDGIGGSNATDDLVSAGGNDLMVAKYSSSGSLVWSKRYGSTGDENPVDGDADAAGNYYVTGSFAGTVDFAGDGAGGDGDLVSAGGNDVFTVKYTTAGAFEWAKRGGGTSADGGFLGGIDVSSNGSTVHIGDLFAGSIDFAENGIGGANSSGDKVASGAQSYPFLVKYTAAVVQSQQTVTWSPTTALLLSDSPRTPSSLASTNGNGNISYSVVSAGTTGCSVASSTGVLTFSAVGSCTVRATAAATSTYLQGSTDVVFVISSGGSTTTVPSSSVTTVPSSNTTVVSSNGGGGSTDGDSEDSQSKGNTVTTVGPAQSTTSTSSSTTSTTTIPAPSAPKVTTGEGGALVNGEAVSVSLSRSGNRITVDAAGVSAIFSGLTPDGKVVALDEDGNLRLNQDDKIVVDAKGYSAGENVEVWMYSTPTRLGTVEASASGAISAAFDLPNSLELGDHRIVLDGQNGDGQAVILGLGIAVGAVESASLLSRLLIAIPLALAAFAAIFIPAVTRRRKRQAAN
jgi:hypothetical protein